MSRALGVVCLLAALFTGGCLGGNETDEVNYVLSIGIDATESKELNITYQIAIPRSIGGKGGEGGGQKSFENVTVRAVNLGEGRGLLNSVVSRNINLSHVKAFIFGEAFARRGVADFMSVAMRFREFRGTMYIAVVANGTAQEYMNENKPILEVLPTKYLESMFLTAKKSGFFLSTQIHDFYRHLKSNRGSPYAALLGINPLTGRGIAESSQTPGEKTKEYIAGNIPRQGSANSSEIIGTALFAGDKMVGTLTGLETRMISILQGKFKNGFAVISDPLAPEKAVNLAVRLDEKPKIKCQYQAGKLKISIEVNMEAELTSIPSGINYESKQFSRQVEEQYSRILEQEFSRTLQKTQLLGSDIVGFGSYLSSQFTTYDEYSAINFEELYSRAEITLKVKTTIRRTGLMWRTKPPEKSSKEG